MERCGHAWVEGTEETHCGVFAEYADRKPNRNRVQLPIRHLCKVLFLRHKAQCDFHLQEQKARPFEDHHSLRHFVHTVSGEKVQRKQFCSPGRKHKLECVAEQGWQRTTEESVRRQTVEPEQD